MHRYFKRVNGPSGSTVRIGFSIDAYKSFVDVCFNLCCGHKVILQYVRS